MNDLGERLRDAAEALPVPTFPGARIAQRIASPSPVPGIAGWRPLRAIAVSGALVLAGLAAAPPARQVMSDAAQRTFERLTGHRVRAVLSSDVPPPSVREARIRTRFPIVVPPGFEVVDTLAWDKDRGATLMIRDPQLGVVMLKERWVTVPPPQLENVGIHDDGSIRRFNVRRWTIGRIAFSVTMFDPHYHAIAERIERATREAAAATR